MVSEVKIVPETTIVAKMLTQLMVEKGMTQADVANTVGVSPIHRLSVRDRDRSPAW